LLVAAKSQVLRNIDGSNDAGRPSSLGLGTDAEAGVEACAGMKQENTAGTGMKIKSASYLQRCFDALATT
jgi:hypothetical protein